MRNGAAFHLSSLTLVADFSHGGEWVVGARGGKGDSPPSGRNRPRETRRSASSGGTPPARAWLGARGGRGGRAAPRSAAQASGGRPASAARSRRGPRLSPTRRPGTQRQGCPLQRPRASRAADTCVRGSLTKEKHDPGKSASAAAHSRTTHDVPHETPRAWPLRASPPVSTSGRRTRNGRPSTSCTARRGSRGSVQLLTSGQRGSGSARSTRRGKGPRAKGEESDAAKRRRRGLSVAPSTAAWLRRRWRRPLTSRSRRRRRRVERGATEPGPARRS